jgi:hypothetical protein
MKFFRIAIILVCTSILVNFKIGDIYLSYMVAFIAAGILVFDIGIRTGKISSKVFLYILIFSYTIFVSLVLKVWASGKLDFYFIDGINWPIYSKAFLFLLYFTAGTTYFKNHRFFYEFLNLLLIFTILFCLRFWIEGFTTIFTGNVNDIDSRRYYPFWIGGWNTISFIISISVVYLITIRGLVGFSSWALLLFFLLTMLATQSRGGILFLLIAVFITHFRFQSFKASPNKIFIFTVILISLSFVPIVRDLVIERLWGSFTNFTRTDISYLQFVTSGRTVQWFDFYVKFFQQTNQFQYFVGYGLGHYGWENATGTETSLHNTLFQFIYDFGIVLGGFLFIQVGFKLLRKKNLPIRATSRFLSIVGILTFLTLLVQELLFITQVIPIVAILFGCYFSLKTSAVKPRALSI